MVQKTLEICLSETHASGNREVRTKDPSPEAMLIPDAKDDDGKGMKGGQKEGTQKQKVRKLYPKVQVHPGECSKEQSQVWKLCAS